MTEKLRVHELAKRMKKTSKEVLEALEKMNVNVKNHMSTIEADVAKKVEERFGIKQENTNKQQPKNNNQRQNNKNRRPRGRRARGINQGRRRAPSKRQEMPLPEKITFEDSLTVGA